ncbi:MAG: GNAT family N-acetyltransferase [Ignavibacteriae bacterium HGW-Ignavibacteriae-1]|jgi:GNAT superfamily N-acetyltransferase|nr:MAG: GNAT family N-acetyltransferase [Ignavibacteriae bacterium HGW-Ignavibacteriae-1]
MTETKLFNSEKKPSVAEKQEIVDFLFHNLDQFGDKKEDIEKAINYAIKESQSPGGFVMVSHHGAEMSCAVVVNETGMEGYIPENILVYIATHKNMRGKGVGKELMTKAINAANGNIALHVEPENPARYLYEKLGFTSKYLEMRLIK